MTGKAMVRKDGAYFPVEVNSLSARAYQCKETVAEYETESHGIKMRRESFFDLKKIGSSCNNWVYYMTMNIGKSKMTTLKTISKTFMIDTEQMKKSGLEIMNMDPVFNSIDT